MSGGFHALSEAIVRARTYRELIQSDDDDDYLMNESKRSLPPGHDALLCSASDRDPLQHYVQSRYCVFVLILFTVYVGVSPCVAFHLLCLSACGQFRVGFTRKIKLNTNELGYKSSQ